MKTNTVLITLVALDLGLLGLYAVLQPREPEAKRGVVAVPPTNERPPSAARIAPHRFATNSTISNMAGTSNGQLVYGNLSDFGSSGGRYTGSLISTPSVPQVSKLPIQRIKRASGAATKTPLDKSQPISRNALTDRSALSSASSGTPTYGNPALPQQTLIENRERLDPDAPGNSFSQNGVTVSARELVSSSDVNGGAPDLLVDTQNNSASAQPATTPAVRPATASSVAQFTSPFTREEELFRTKWGWQAFDAVRSMARQSLFPTR